MTDVFPVGLGWPLEVAAILGCIYALYRRDPESLILAGTALVYFFLIARLHAKPIRYFAVMGPVFALLAARFLVEDFPCARGKLYRMAAVGSVILVCGYTTAYAVAFVTIYREPDTRVEAARWLQAHVPAGKTVLMERGHNSLWGLVSGERYRRKLMHIEEEVFYGRNEFLARNGDYLACLDGEYLSAADHLLISDDRMALSTWNPAAKYYYEGLFNGRLGYDLVRRYRAHPELFGAAFGSTPDPDFRRYDHPVVCIFRRMREAPIYTERSDLDLYRLASWSDCREVLKRAIDLEDYILFRRCLTRKIKASESDALLTKLFQQILRNPDMRQRLAQITPASGAFVEEDGVWRLNLYTEE